MEHFGEFEHQPDVRAILVQGMQASGKLPAEGITVLSLFDGIAGEDAVWRMLPCMPLGVNALSRKLL